jgi:hypothetical protein
VVDQQRSDQATAAYETQQFSARNTETNPNETPSVDELISR